MLGDRIFTFTVGNSLQVLICRAYLEWYNFSCLRAESRLRIGEVTIFRLLGVLIRDYTAILLRDLIKRRTIGSFNFRMN